MRSKPFPGAFDPQRLIRLVGLIIIGDHWGIKGSIMAPALTLLMYADRRRRVKLQIPAAISAASVKILCMQHGLPKISMFHN